jgi:hypothetical protein
MQQGPIIASLFRISAGKNASLKFNDFFRNSQLQSSRFDENLTGKQACHVDGLAPLIDGLTASCVALIRPQEGITPFEEKLIRVDTQRITSDLLERYLDPLAQLHLAGMQGDDLRLVKRQPMMKAGIFDNA